MVNLFLSTTLFVGLLVTNSNVLGDKASLELNYDKLEAIKGKGIFEINLQIKKTGFVQFTINGFVNLLEQLDDTWGMVLHLCKYHETDVNYQCLGRYPRKDSKGICAVLKNEYKEHFYETLKNYSNAPYYDTCPLNPAKYTLTNYPFDAEKWMKFFSEGKYRLEIILKQDNETKVHYNLYFHVVQRNT